MVKIVKNNIKLVIGVVIGVIISVISSYTLAETLIKSVDVSYVDNSNLKATNVQTAIDGTCTKFSNDLQSFLLKVYPVGSIYISYDSTNPGTLFGGTWEVFGKGQTLVGIDTSQTEFETVGKTGGEKTHTLTINEMPSHTHDISNGPYQIYTEWIGSGEGSTFRSTPHMQSPNPRNPIVASNTGGSQAHNNLQPYITVYMWRRTK